MLTIEMTNGYLVLNGYCVPWLLTRDLVPVLQLLTYLITSCLYVLAYSHSMPKGMRVK